MKNKLQVFKRILIKFCVIILVCSCSSKPRNLELAKEYPIPEEEKTIKNLAETIRVDLAKKI